MKFITLLTFLLYAAVPNANAEPEHTNLLERALRRLGQAPRIIAERYKAVSLPDDEQSNKYQETKEDGFLAWFVEKPTIEKSPTTQFDAAEEEGTFEISPSTTNLADVAEESESEAADETNDNRKMIPSIPTHLESCEASETDQNVPERIAHLPTQEKHQFSRSSSFMRALRLKGIRRVSSKRTMNDGRPSFFSEEGQPSDCTSKTIGFPYSLNVVGSPPYSATDVQPLTKSVSHNDLPYGRDVPALRGRLRAWSAPFTRPLGNLNKEKRPEAPRPLISDPILKSTSCAQLKESFACTPLHPA